MRRLRNDLPYRFRPPRGSSAFRPVGLTANREWFLKRKYRIERIDETGFDELRVLEAKGDAILLAPNHADHSDPHVMLEIGGRHELPLHFMAAREVFEGSPLSAWSLQAMGVFSVDRDGPDLAAVRVAIALLRAGKPLVIYPEGEIYHHHERLDPLHEGVASILIKAAAKLREGRGAWLVPVAIRFHHDPAVERSFAGRLARLEERIGWTIRPSMSIDERILRLGRGVLAVKETEFLEEAGQGAIQQRLEHLCGRLLDEVEGRHGDDPRARTAPERVRALRYRIRRRLLHAVDPAKGEERHALLDDLDRVFTALQAHSYIGDYLLENPSLERRAETLMKLEEDILGFPNYPAPRTVRVRAGEAFDVTGMLAAGELAGRGAAGELTRKLEDRLASMLGEL